jgi:hypothetical protein
MVYPFEEFQEYSRRFKTLSQLRVADVKNLPLNGYQHMLNNEPLGREGVPFFFIVSCFVLEKNL